MIGISNTIAWARRPSLQSDKPNAVSPNPQRAPRAQPQCQLTRDPRPVTLEPWTNTGRDPDPAEGCGKGAGSADRSWRVHGDVFRVFESVFQGASEWFKVLWGAVGRLTVLHSAVRCLTLFSRIYAPCERLRVL